MTAEAIFEQESLGLPGEFLYDRRLLFSATSQTLILQCALKRGLVRLPQVYLRGVGESGYTSVLELAKLDLASDAERGRTLFHGVRTPTLQDDVLYFLLTEHEDHGERASMNVLSVGRMTLPRGPLEVWDPKETAPRCTPVELVGADQHGVFANAGIPTPMSPEAGQGHTVSYAIVHLSWQERSVEVVGELPKIFY